MKNFDIEHITENGAAKKTLSRKEYDEQMALRFAAMEEQRHEELSAKAKEAFANMSDEEKQKTMNEFADVENKPLTKELLIRLAKHEDITLFAVASTGLYVKDQSKAIKGKDGGLERITIPHDEPTLFMAETYSYDEASKKYVSKDKTQFFIEAAKEIVDRAIESAKNGGYDVFANSEFVLEDYLAGKGVLPKDEARQQIRDYFANKVGIVCSYGEFHANMLRGSEFPTPENALDLNRITVEQGKYGTASLAACTNKIIGITQKTEKVGLSSTTEKLIADVICLNELLSSYEQEIRFSVKSGELNKFPEADKRKVAMYMQEKGYLISDRPMRSMMDHMGRGNLTHEELEKRHEERLRRVREMNNDPRLPQRTAPLVSSPEVSVPEASEGSAGTVSVATPAANEKAAEIEVDAPINLPLDEASLFEPENAEYILTENGAVKIGQEVSDKPQDNQGEERVLAKEEKTDTEKTQVVPQATPMSFDALVNALNEQNKLLAAQNEIAVKQAQIEESKLSVMEHQAELMARQADATEKLTVLMDNLTKVYSVRDLERIKVNVETKDLNEKIQKQIQQLTEQPVKEKLSIVSDRSVTSGESGKGQQNRLAPAKEVVPEQTENPEQSKADMSGLLREAVDHIINGSEDAEILLESEDYTQDMEKNKADDIAELP